MAITIEWRREPNKQHMGSAELRIPGQRSAPFLYVHPEDNSDAERASSAAKWTYNHDDSRESLVAGPAFTLKVHGYVSYALYMRTARAFQKLNMIERAWYKTKGSSGGQEGIRPDLRPGALDPTPLGPPRPTSIQPSGQCNYNAYLQITPLPANALTLAVIAEYNVYAYGFATPGAQVSANRGIQAGATMYNETAMVHRESVIQELVFPPQLKRRKQQKAYQIVVPAGGFAGGELKIGTLLVGPAYFIDAGGSLFVGRARLSYQITDPTTDTTVGSVTTTGGAGLDSGNDWDGEVPSGEVPSNGGTGESALDNQ
jgi:hypothetical protein